MSMLSRSWNNDRLQSRQSITYIYLHCLYGLVICPVCCKQQDLPLPDKLCFEADAVWLVTVMGNLI